MNVIQSIGADSTYLKRYLLVNAFLILEDDVADALEPDADTSKKSEVSVKEKKSEKPETPSIITQALIGLDKKGVKITRASVYSKCTQIGLNEDNRKEVMNWIENNIKEEA